MNFFNQVLGLLCQSIPHDIFYLPIVIFRYSVSWRKANTCCEWILNMGLCFFIKWDIKKAILAFKLLHETHPSRCPKGRTV